MIATTAFDSTMKAIGAAAWVGRKVLNKGVIDLGKSTIGLDSREESSKIRDLATAAEVLIRKVAEVDSKIDDTIWKLDLMLPQDAQKLPRPRHASPTEQPTIASDPTPAGPPSGDDGPFENVF